MGTFLIFAVGILTGGLAVTTIRFITGGPAVFIHPEPAIGCRPHQSHLAAATWRVVTDRHARDFFGHPNGLMIWLDDALGLYDEGQEAAYAAGRDDEREQPSTGYTGPADSYDVRHLGMNVILKNPPHSRRGKIAKVSRIVLTKETTDLYLTWPDRDSEDGPYFISEVSAVAVDSKNYPDFAAFEVVAARLDGDPDRIAAAVDKLSKEIDRRTQPLGADPS